MITVFNALLECFTTALFVVLILKGFAHLGIIPTLMMVFTEEEEGTENKGDDYE